MAKKKSKAEALVAIWMGSDSDLPIMKDAIAALDQFKIPHTAKIVSAHRTPELMFGEAKKARRAGIKVIIAGAGGAAHLPGMVAAVTELPVIGVPIPHGNLHGEDSLLSIVQMPKGVPVATVAIGNAWNAGILAAQILGVWKAEWLDQIRDYKDRLDAMVRKKQV